MQVIERWGVFEAALHGKTEGNPFTDYEISGIFTSSKETVRVTGFYDGDDIYKVRFMPSFTGEYSYEISGSFSDEVFTGEFTACEASGNNHGPVRVANTYHFAYEDGTPYYSVGTTCYVWDLQPEEVHQKTLEELRKGYFNKMRFCVFPKHYIHNFRDPISFPFEGTPMDSSWLNEENFQTDVDLSDNDWDFTRLNPGHFRNVERCIAELMELGIEADLIVMHPYDRWGFSHMDRTADDLYWKYVLARFSCFRNIWWSLANEYDLLYDKTLEDWEHYADLILTYDPYHHLRSIHNCHAFYDFTRPWITHCSMQRQDLYRHVEYTNDYRIRYGKPVVWDELAYEGDIDQGWGNITGEELIRRFWEGSLRGGYCGHGETYTVPDDILWWSHGGELHGESPARIRFLHGILCQTPGIGLKEVPGEFDELVSVAELAPAEDYRIYYYGFGRPSFRKFSMPEGISYKAEVIDTWDMTVTDAGIHTGTFRIPLPAKQYMAIRLTRV